MRSIRKKDTKAELTVRRAVHALLAARNTAFDGNTAGRCDRARFESPGRTLGKGQVGSNVTYPTQGSAASFRLHDGHGCKQFRPRGGTIKLQRTANLALTGGSTAAISSFPMM